MQNWTAKPITTALTAIWFAAVKKGVSPRFNLEVGYEVMEQFSLESLPLIREVPPDQEQKFPAGQVYFKTSIMKATGPGWFIKVVDAGAGDKWLGEVLNAVEQKD